MYTNCDSRWVTINEDVVDTVEGHSEHYSGELHPMCHSVDLVEEVTLGTKESWVLLSLPKWRTYMRGRGEPAHRWLLTPILDEATQRLFGFTLRPVTNSLSIRIHQRNIR